MTPDAKTYLTTPELAGMLRCSSRQIPRLRERGMPAVMVGNLVRFDIAAVQQWLASRPQRMVFDDSTTKTLYTHPTPPTTL